MPVTMNIAGETAIDVMKQIGELAALAAGNPLDKIETEALLAELRDRLAKNGQVVKIVPFDNEKTSGEGNSPAATTRGRQRKSQAEAASDGGAKASAAPAAIEEAEQTIADNSPTVPANAEVTIMAPATLEEVKSALNAFAAANGQVEARKIMQDAGGSAALKDVPVEKFNDLILALQNGTVKQAA